MNICGNYIDVYIYNNNITYINYVYLKRNGTNNNCEKEALQQNLKN